MTEMSCDAKVESILTGGSGSITMQSPELWRKFSLPTLKAIGKLGREAGVITGIHSCGKETYLVKTVAEETQIDYVNPLEIPPMGDCELADLKAKYGSRVALMGNLHTTEVMLNGSRDRVRRESLQAMLDAGEGGGFVLSTGDQCGYHTPLENIFAMVETAKVWGAYPLDRTAMAEEARRLANAR
jgi:uroporphyrinogen decarboxylase